jgi:hypothetical protein
LEGYREAGRDILVSISRSRSSVCGQELRIEARPVSAATKGPSPVLVYCGVSGHDPLRRSGIDAVIDQLRSGFQPHDPFQFGSGA